MIGQITRNPNTHIFHADAPLSGPNQFQRAEGLDPQAKEITQKVGEIYLYTAAAFAASCITAIVSANLGIAYSVASAIVNAPIITLVAFCAIGAGLIYNTVTTPKEDLSAKKLACGAFATFQGIMISPLALISSSTFITAAAATTAIMGGLGGLAVTLEESFEKYEKIISVAMGIILAASFGALFLSGAAATFAHEVCLIGGLALFSTLVIYDTHLARAKIKEGIEIDTINESLKIYQDAMSLLVRLYELMERNKKKK